MSNFGEPNIHERIDWEAERARVPTTRLNEWYLAILLEDRAETAVPPPELLEEGGHG